MVLPQYLVITALALSIVIKIKKHYNSIDSDDIRRIRG